MIVKLLTSVQLYNTCATCGVLDPSCIYSVAGRRYHESHDMTYAGSETRRWKTSQHFDTLHYFSKCIHSHIRSIVRICDLGPEIGHLKCALYSGVLSSHPAAST